jgi:K+ transporter
LVKDDYREGIFEGRGGMRNTDELLRFLGGRLSVLACTVMAAVSLVCVLRGEFNAELPLGIAMGAALGFGRMCMTGRLFPLVMAARHGKTAVAVVNQFLGLALVAAFLFFCIKSSVRLFAGGAVGLSLIPVVILLNYKKMYSEG